MINPIPSATYRIQFREGVTFERIEKQLRYIKELGISHLYLSPIFRAPAGSTHGYDVLGPTVVDPSLGGIEGFERLAQSAHTTGLGLILDIVPNHTAFVLENQWLADVLRHGQASEYAPYFDIDWSRGPLVLPFLPEPIGQMISLGQLQARSGYLEFGETRVPLSATGPQAAQSSQDLEDLLRAQHWRLRHWETERDGITHRRFFNVTSLIGMRVEDPDVFAATHKLILKLVRQGLVDGLRVDHIDGLSDPKGYLERLSPALPDTPIWVEKILVGQETLDPAWKTVGTTGYEAARLIARLLTDRDGIARIDTHWRNYTGLGENFREALTTAKRDILQFDLSAELHQLVNLADAALADDGSVEAGPEALREAICELLICMPRYRTYVDAKGASGEDKSLIDAIVDQAASRLRSSRVVRRLGEHIKQPVTDSDMRFAIRLQQVSGALLAKAQEDTAGFRWSRYLAANEVGAEPDEPTVSDAEANAFLASRRASEMTLTSTHDTKRSEDSRMRLVAISHHADAFDRLVRDADRLAPAELSPRWRWYIVQSVLALWGEDPHTLADRLHQHNQKALREAKLESFWTKPDEQIESAADRFTDALLSEWRDRTPGELSAIIETANALSLAQVALKCLLPGFPDIYRGGEGAFFALTDPDNRLAVDWDVLAKLAAGAEGFARHKAALTRLLLALRRDEADFFDKALSHVQQDHGLTLRRALNGRALQLTFGKETEGHALWRSGAGRSALAIAWA
ncbi:maltooligosyl trehalose synthase [Devosia lucknowensis]|uniref:Maltooligosyl trehalose synthase n=1 Tax=Devosia lucknowensis TaxID=1096929 RepID=A0A1Y6E6S5_9HYPH|nr:malto-oligosyltrehalose synthase [Devosia lucknowensis]SMQ58435.1 maltooligosyl trehalose synthase [Devosia lucknowensis]